MKQLPVTDLPHFLANLVSPVRDQEHHAFGRLTLQIENKREVLSIGDKRCSIDKTDHFGPRVGLGHGYIFLFK